MLLLKVKKSCSGGRGDNTGFDCFHQVGYGLLNSRQLIFHSFNVKLMVFLFEVSNGAVHDEVYGFIMNSIRVCLMLMPLARASSSLSERMFSRQRSR